MTVLRVLSPTCDRCGRSSEDIATFAQTYRELEAQHKRRNPGNLCGECAGVDTARRLILENVKIETMKIQ